MDFWNSFLSVITPYIPILQIPSALQSSPGVFQIIKDTAALALEKIAEQLPDGGNLPTSMHDGAIYLGSTLSKADVFFPTYDLLALMALTFKIVVTLWAFHIGMYLSNYLRGIPTSRFQMGGVPESGVLTKEQSYSAKVRALRNW